jgi:asparagine synthase (glutamine-hydrolysing)
MCGIAGAINFTINQQAVNQVMLHRGPDEQNGWQADNIDFYHLRLSIIDIAGGKQPMHLADRFSIIFNGEIYNYKQVNSHFGLPAATNSDTETLLHLYQKMGANMLAYLDGMFVMAIYDNQEKTLFIARDRAGKKPLYYFSDLEKFVFASELNALHAMLPLQMDDNHISHYLRLGSLHGAATPYRQVAELKAGHYITINCLTLQQSITQWWTIDRFYEISSQDDFETALAKTGDYLHQGVKRRIESSDLEVGCFLSGGIDSGLITAMAAGIKNKLKTFTVSFAGEYNEGPLARQVAEKYQTQHTEIPISFDHLINDVEKMLCNYGEPFFDSSAIPSYYVSQEARKHLTVILNGDGADELFGGYRRYVPFAQYDFFKPNPLVKGTAGIARYLLPPANSKQSAYNYVYRLASMASKDNLSLYLSAGVDIFEDMEQHLVQPSTDKYLQLIEHEIAVIAKKNMSGLNKIMNLDFNVNLSNDLLVKMDIATMAHSLEGRSPFLCKELLEYAPTLNEGYKIKRKTTKYLLRKIAEHYLPPDLIHQPKRGFEIPLKNWVNNQLKDLIYDYLCNPQNISRQFVNSQFIKDLLNNKVILPAEKRAKILWTLFSLEVWYHKVYKVGKC